MHQCLVDVGTLLHFEQLVVYVVCKLSHILFVAGDQVSDRIYKHQFKAIVEFERCHKRIGIVLHPFQVENTGCSRG
jgi:hypothetical protein